MTIENITLIMCGICFLISLTIPLITRFYLDKKYSKIKKNIQYDLPNVPYSDDRSFHRFCGYITIFLFNDQSRQRDRNLLAQYIKPEIDVKKLVKIGAWEKIIGVFYLATVIVFIINLIIFYIVSKGWPINLFYGIERKMSLQQQKSFGAFFILMGFVILRWIYKFIKKRLSK